jgi:hypothetical protein
MADIVHRAIGDKEPLTKSRPSPLFCTDGFTEKFRFLIALRGSKIPEQDLHAPETYHAEEVFDVVLPAGHEPTKVMEPGEKPFHSPTLSVAPQRACVLCGCATLLAVRRDHLDSITLGQILIQSVAVVCFVAD